MKVAGLKFGRHGCDLVVVQERSDGAKILARRDIAKAREEADR